MRSKTPAAGLLASVVLVFALLACDTDGQRSQDRDVAPDTVSGDLGGNAADTDTLTDLSAADTSLTDTTEADRPDVSSEDSDAVEDVGASDSAVVDAGAADTDPPVDEGVADTGSPGSFCNTTVGVREPLAVCSPEQPCTRPSALLRVDEITLPTETPTCGTTAVGRLIFDDGAPLTYTDLDGLERYTCEYRPPGTSTVVPRPLVLFFHGTGGVADNVYDFTSLRTKAPNFDLSGDVARAGFILVSVQGRNLAWPTADARDSSHHDIYHRALGAPSTNRDVAFADDIIDGLVTEGVVDPQRIYVMGWSNGGHFAQLYAISRHETSTAGGNRVAAAAVFSAGDPFHDTRLDDDISCRLDPYPTSQVPIFIASRACDLVACDEAQAVDLEGEGLAATPGFVVETWMATLSERVGNPNAEWRIISGFGRTVVACTGTVLCSQAAAVLNHLHWPDGISDSSGIDHEIDLLTFLREHPLPQE